jgi:lipopolysaccharide export system protein LptA
VKLTQWLLICVFIGICGSIVGLSLLGNWDGGEFRNLKAASSGEKQNEESFFKNAEYFFLKDYKKSLTLISDEMAIDSTTGKSVFLAPKGIAYTGTQKPISYKGKTGLLKEGKEELTLEGDVFMEVELSRYSADKLEYNILKDELISTGNVHSFSKSRKTGDEIEINAERSLSYPKLEKSQYTGSVRGKILRKRAYEENILFNSNELDLDMIKHQIDLVGDVRIKKQAFTADAFKGEIFLENYNKRLKYFVLYDDVKVVETISPSDGSASFTRRAFSEKLEGIVSEGKIILTGAPKVYQHKDVIKGNKIVLRENNEVVEVDDANTKFDLK